MFGFLYNFHNYIMKTKIHNISLSIIGAIMLAFALITITFTIVRLANIDKPNEVPNITSWDFRIKIEDTDYLASLNDDEFYSTDNWEWLEEPSGYYTSSIKMSYTIEFSIVDESLRLNSCEFAYEISIFDNEDWFVYYQPFDCESNLIVGQTYDCFDVNVDSNVRALFTLSGDFINPEPRMNTDYFSFYGSELHYNETIINKDKETIIII